MDAQNPLNPLNPFESQVTGKKDLWYADDKYPVLLNLSGADKISLIGDRIKVQNGPVTSEILCKNAEIARFLFGTVVSNFINNDRVLSQPREMTPEEKDAIQRNAATNGNQAVSQSPEVSGIDPATLQGGGATEGGKAPPIVSALTGAPAAVQGEAIEPDKAPAKEYHESSKELEGLKAVK